MIPWFVLLIPTAFVVFGGVFALKGVSLRRQGRVCAQWPVASGKILEARQEVQFVENRNDRRRRDDEFFGATVRYAYQVDGRDYRSTRLYLGRPVFGGSPKFAQDIIAKYPAWGVGIGVLQSGQSSGPAAGYQGTASATWPRRQGD